MKNPNDKILNQALELHEDGMSPKEIYARFPEAAPELREFFALTGRLHAEAERIPPPSREVLRAALRRAVAEEAAPRPAAGAGLFAGIPMVLRLLAPALAVAVLIFFVGISPQDPLLPPPPPSATEPSSGSVPTAFEPAAPESVPDAGPAPAARISQDDADDDASEPMALMTAPAGAGTASEAASSDPLTQAYLDFAAAEEAQLVAGSGEIPAPGCDPEAAWESEDAAIGADREEFDEENAAALRASLADLRDRIEAAEAARREAVNSAMAAFRGEVRAQTSSANCANERIRPNDDILTRYYSALGTARDDFRADLEPRP